MQLLAGCLMIALGLRLIPTTLLISAAHLTRSDRKTPQQA
jgi:hypothetical protein